MTSPSTPSVDQRRPSRRTSFTVHGTTRSPSACAASTSSRVTTSCRGPIVRATVAIGCGPRRGTSSRPVERSRPIAASTGSENEQTAIRVEIRPQRLRRTPAQTASRREALRLDHQRSCARPARAPARSRGPTRRRGRRRARRRSHRRRAPTSISIDDGAAASSRRIVSGSLPRCAWISNATAPRFAARSTVSGSQLGRTAVTGR